MSSVLKMIDEAQLEADLGYRFEYLTEFMGFSAEDIDTIHGAAEALAPLAPSLVDAVYVKLFSYDATKRHFVPRQSGYEGNDPGESARTGTRSRTDTVPQAAPDELPGQTCHRPIRRKSGCLSRSGWQDSYPGKGSPNINVPLVQMNALMGFVADAFNATIFSLGLPSDQTEKAIRAFSKLLWLQNDLINRHYCQTV